MPGKKQKVILIFFSLFFFLFNRPCLSQDHPYLLDKELLDLIQNEVSGERAWDMVSKISRFHRIRGGGDGSDYNRCVEFLAKELKGLGLKEIFIKKYMADGHQKYFLWPSLVGWRVREAELWMVKPRKKLISRFSDQAVSLMPYSQGSEVESEVIFVGKGKSDEDYKGKNVKGKLVFAVDGNGSAVHRQAVLNRGAAGVIVGPSDREDRLEFPDLIELYRLSPTGEERAKTGFGFALSRRQEKELLSLFESGEKVMMRASVDAELFDGDMPVLEAKIIGKEYPEQEIILMAHLDHYKPGANDNASGSAGLFEMVRNILALTEKGDIPPLKRTLRFLWLPEMHGAAAYLTEHQGLKETGICGMNLDMIGEDYVLCRSNFNLFCSPYSVPGYIDDVLVNFLGWLDGRAFFSPRGGRHRFNFRVRPYSGGSDHVLFNDSTFSIPTPMLGHGDVFHHTSMDTPDKCDPTEMKRIISLALAASLLIANADDEDALKIAREVHSQAHVRMTARTEKSVRLMHQYASDPNKVKELTELHANLLNYPRLQAQVEAENIREVNELCRNEASQKIIHQLSGDLGHQAEREAEKIGVMYEIFIKRYGLKSENYCLRSEYEEASRLRPKRMFKGPLHRNAMREKLSAKSLEWYDKNRAKAGGSYGSKTYEIVNLMNGKRTLVDIRHIISCEFDETDVEFVLHYAKDLEKIGLVSFE